MHINDPVTTPRGDEFHVEVVDRLPPELRSCVHDFGYSTVHAFVLAGITRPKTIRHLVTTVWRGAPEPGNKAISGVYPGGRILTQIDNVLRSFGGPAVSRSIIAALRQVGFTIVMTEPTIEMVEASCAAVANKTGVAYEQKHRLRLRAGLREGDAQCWGWMDQ